MPRYERHRRGDDSGLGAAGLDEGRYYRSKGKEADPHRVAPLPQFSAAQHELDCVGGPRLLLPSSATVVAIQPVELDQTGIGQLAESLGIGEQFDPTHALSNEGLEQPGVPRWP